MFWEYHSSAKVEHYQPVSTSFHPCQMRFRVMTPTASDAASTNSETAAAKASLLGLTSSALSASEAEWEEDSLDGRNQIGRSNGGAASSRNSRARAAAAAAAAGFGDYTSVSHCQTAKNFHLSAGWPTTSDT